MRAFIIIIIFLHGAIHLLGFVKSFELVAVKQLTEPISRSFGIMWLLAFVLFFTTGIMAVFKFEYWWLPGVSAVVLSQVMIIGSWQDARFGTIANIIILVALVIGSGTWAFYKKYEDDVKQAFSQQAAKVDSLLTENDIVTLPEPVKKYLRYTGSIGKPKVNHFTIDFIGKIRKNEQSPWMEFTSEQYNFLQPFTRLFFMKATMKHLPVAGYHCFKNGKAFMDIRLLSLLRVQYQEGADMDVAETVTFFNDMCCLAPPTLIDKRIGWLETNSNKIRASFTNNNITIYAWLLFNDQGELINFISNDRYAADAGKKLPWSTPLRDYRELNGYRLASHANAVYAYAGGDLIYGTFELSHVQYNGATTHAAKPLSPASTNDFLQQLR